MSSHNMDTTKIEELAPSVSTPTNTIELQTIAKRYLECDALENPGTNETLIETPVVIENINGNTEGANKKTSVSMKECECMSNTLDFSESKDEESNSNGKF